MIQARLRVHRRDVLIGILAVISVAAYVIAAARTHATGFPLDDAWIHQTYARNLAERGEWAFVPGMPSAASTSPLFTALIAVGYALRLPFFWWTFALSALALAGAGWLGARLGEQVFPKLPGVGLWTGAVMILTWHLIWAAASGMETMLFSTLSLAVVWLAWRDRPTGSPAAAGWGAFRRGAVLGLVGAALTLTRPEGAGLVGLAGLGMLLARPYGSVRQHWRAYLAWGGGMMCGWLVGVLPYAAFNYHLSQGVLPDTASAKQAEHASALAQPLIRRYLRLLVPVLAGGQAVLLPGVVFALWNLRRPMRGRGLFFVPLAWAALLLTAYALRLPVAYQHGRYVMPILPHLLVYGVGGTLAMVARGRRRVITRVLSRSLALSALAVTLAFWVLGARAYAQDVRIINTEMVDTARWVNQHVPPDRLLAVHDIGALGYYAPRPILDLAGLVSPEVIPIIRDHPALMRLMCERDVRYLMVLPDQLPTTPDDPRLGPEPIFKTNAPFAPAAGGGNMAVYRLGWPDRCE